MALPNENTTPDPRVRILMRFLYNRIHLAKCEWYNAHMDYTLHTTFPDELEAEWNALLAESITDVPFLRHEYLKHWWQTRGGGEWPQSSLAVVTARRDGQLVGVAPLFHTTNRDQQPALLFLGAIEISDYLDWIVRPADLDEFVAGLLPFLSQAELPHWEALDLYNFLDSSIGLTATQKALTAIGWAQDTSVLQPSPYIPLPGDWETYLAGIDKKQRHEIRRKMRRAESAEIPVTWRIVTDPATIEAEMEDFMALMAQDPEKEGFLTPPMREQFHLTARAAIDRGYLMLAFLEIGGVKAAGYFSVDYLNRLWVYNSGISRDFNDYSPGWVLLGYLLQWANENKRAHFDFMRGKEEYKYRFGGVNRFVMRLKAEPKLAP